MSTQSHLTPQWKEEVNRRIAAHKNRKGQPSEPETHADPNLGASRAAQAAARVAARYAKAPSYSQMQAEEARVAVRAAEIATKVALEAQAVAETALAELHAATQAARRPAVVQPIAPVRKVEDPPAAVPQAGLKANPASEPPLEPSHSAVELSPAPQESPVEPRVFDIRWDPDMPVRPLDKTPAARRTQEEFDLSVEDWWSPAEVNESLRSNPIEVGDDEPEHAKLIQFPRELVAARKMRPRLAEARAEWEGQLSIFEVDPASVSTEAAVAAEQGGAMSTWSGMRLDSQPAGAPAAMREADAADALPVAPFGMRLMATVVDCSLILASFVTAGFLAAHQLQNPPVGKPAEWLGVAGMALIGMLYYALFFSLPACTPGMKYAGVGLCTFDNQSPTRAQLRRRLVAMTLSLLPVGLGLVWSLFDEDHLSWHDRFSKTYLRKL